MAARRQEPAETAPDLAGTVTVLARVLARLACSRSQVRGPATFRQIATTELKIATDEEVTVIEAWLTAHPPA